MVGERRPVPPIRSIRDLPAQEVFVALETPPTGLSFEESRRRLARYGPNVLQLRTVSLTYRFLCQFTHFLALLLWAAAGLAFVADYLHRREGMATLGWAIVGVIVVNAVFAFLQEYRAERAVVALRQLLPSHAWILREGKRLQVPRTEIVPGDLLVLEEGEQVPADARLVEAVGMTVDNSSLTGESRPKRRTADPVRDAHEYDTANLVFAGTTVLAGHGQALVLATGMRTEFGQIAALTASVEPGLSPLQKEIARVTHIVAVLSVAMGAVFFTIGVVMGLGFWISAIFGIGIIVANVPEGLLPTVTLALAMGSQRMAKRRALIKHLPSVETLGCTTVICTDKTGTLTQNRMTVDQFAFDGVIVKVRDGCLWMGGQVIALSEMDRWRSFFDALIHCHNARQVRQPDGRMMVTGDPTETALLEFAIAHGLIHRPTFRRMGELPFDADRKRMSTLHWVEGRLMAFTKGAPESLLPLCSRVRHGDECRVMMPNERGEIMDQSRALAEQAYRVLAFASRPVGDGTETLDVDRVEHDLTFLGLVAMLDPPHREVPEAIARCRRAGIRSIMITGDHPSTALAIARQIGLAPATHDPSRLMRVIEGNQLDLLTDEQLRHLLTPSSPGEPDPIFARMAPRHKMRIVVALKDLGEIVAVTGDGVNDAPALKKADIGIAMGLAGTDVAKETADIILLDDSFATIVNAIEEGRAVYANIRKFVTYVLASNVPEIMPYLAFGFFSMPLALTVPQILAIDLGTDMLPALALGADPPLPGIMEQKPRPRSERLLDRRLLLRSYGFLGLIEAAIALSAFLLYLAVNGWSWGTALDWSSSLYQEATTVTLSAIVIAQVANLFACRSEHLSLVHLRPFDNPLIFIGIGVEVTLLLLIVYTPFGHWVVGSRPLPLWIWWPLVLCAVGLLVAEEIRKLVSSWRRGDACGITPSRT